VRVVSSKEQSSLGYYISLVGIAGVGVTALIVYAYQLHLYDAHRNDRPGVRPPLSPAPFPFPSLSSRLTKHVLFSLR
jgi:hypothetical protein